jgi:ribosomal protein L11 methyltransferase
MTDIVEILIKSDKSITELDDDFLFSHNVLSVSQYTYNGELYFNILFDEKERSYIKKIISKLFGSSQDFRINKVENKNWVLESQKTLEPLSFNGLYIHNDGHKKDKNKKINICVNEGLAFGTGHHGTTAGCVNALLEIQKTINVKYFLDIGTGSGLLSIAANKIWKCRGIGIDHDKKSIEVARNNIIKNNCRNKVKVRLLDITTESYKLRCSVKFDLIMINILANVIVQAKWEIANLISKNGILIVSGFTKEQKKKVRVSYQNLGFIVLRDFTINNWVTLVMRAPTF